MLYIVSYILYIIWYISYIIYYMLHIIYYILHITYYIYWKLYIIRYIWSIIYSEHGHLSFGGHLSFALKQSIANMEPISAHMDPYGPMWAPYGAAWAPYGPIWTYMDPYGAIWTHGPIMCECILMRAEWCWPCPRPDRVRCKHALLRFTSAQEPMVGTWADWQWLTCSPRGWLIGSL